jgi:hypothetical protein
MTRGLFAAALVVCTETSEWFDLVTQSPNFGDDGRAVILLSEAVRLAVEVETPT